MFIELTPEQRQLQAELRQYFSNLISSDEMKAMEKDRHNEAYRAVIRRMGQDGKLGVGWPKEFGGLGFGPIEQSIFVNEAHRADVPLPAVTLQTVGPVLQQFGRPLSTFQTVAAQLAEVYIASRTIDLASTSVIWRLAEKGGDAPDVQADLDVLGYWITSQAPRVMQICHHLHGGMGMDITYPMHRYYSTIKDLTRLLGGPSHRLDLVGAQCSST